MLYTSSLGLDKMHHLDGQPDKHLLGLSVFAKCTTTLGWCLRSFSVIFGDVFLINKKCSLSRFIHELDLTWFMTELAMLFSTT